MFCCYVIRDKLGKLALSPKQKAVFSRWVRPDEICNNPTMILSVSSFSIKQVRLEDVQTRLPALLKNSSGKVPELKLKFSNHVFWLFLC